MVAVVSGAQFTKGPWIADEFCEENDQATRVGTYDGTPLYYHRTATIALCQTNHDDDEPAGVPKIGIVEAEANARLIAAAPNGHTIVERLVEHLRGDFRIPDNADEGWVVDSLGHGLGGIYLDALAYLSAVRGDHE